MFRELSLTVWSEHTHAAGMTTISHQYNRLFDGLVSVLSAGVKMPQTLPNMLEGTIGRKTSLWTVSRLLKYPLCLTLLHRLLLWLQQQHLAWLLISWCRKQILVYFYARLCISRGDPVLSPYSVSLTCQWENYRWCHCWLITEMFSQMPP